MTNVPDDEPEDLSARPYRDDWKRILKALPLFDIPDVDRRIVGFLTSQGEGYSWINHERSTISVGLALELGLTEWTVRRSTRRLHKNRWLLPFYDPKNHEGVKLTLAVTAAADDALAHQQVRRWVGSHTWERISEGVPSGELEEKLLAEAEAFDTPKRKSKRVELVAHQRYLDMSDR